MEIPVIFEVLENCSAGVIIGEQVLWEHDVFQTHAASIHELKYRNGEDELSDLAPFDYKNRLQHKLSDWKQILQSKFNGRISHRYQKKTDH